MSLEKLGNFMSFVLAVGIVCFWITTDWRVVVVDMMLCIIRLVLCVFEYGFEEVNYVHHTDKGYLQGC